MNNKSEKIIASQNTEEVTNVNVITEEVRVLQYNQTCNVRIPKADDKILLDFSIISKIRKKCSEAMKERFPWAEIVLAFSFLFLGAVLNAYFARIPYQNTLLSFFSYTLCPVGGIGFFVAYCFIRKKSVNDIKSFAKEIDGYIKNYDRENNEDI